MKFIYLVVLACFSQLCVAQKVLMPYRVDSLFGLSDANGKIIVKPAYDNVSWMTGTWFRTSKKIQLKDTLETAPHKFYILNSKVNLSGLINNGKDVLNNEPFDDYEIIIDKCIVAKYQGRGTDLTKEQYKKYGDKRKLYSIFNLQGKNIYPENFKSIRKMDTAGVSKDKVGARYILFWVVSFEERHSFLVFDVDKQEVHNWLVKNARNLRPEPKAMPHQFLVGITDSIGNMSTQLLDYSGGEFLLKPTLTVQKKQRRDYDDVIEVAEGYSGSGNGTGRSDYRGEDVVEAPREDYSAPKEKPKFNPYHIFVKDSLFYITSLENKTKVKLPEGARVIRLVPYSITQYQPVMVIADNHFYIVKDDQLGTTVYDSLIYFGQNFLAWKKVDGKTKAGVINTKDSVIIPFVYDSLYAGIRYLELIDRTPASQTRHYQVMFTEADSRYSRDRVNPYSRSYNSYVTAYTKDKCGVINLKGDTIIPFNYQMIAKNSMQYSKPREDEFILLKKNGRYGITTLKHHHEKKHDVMSDATIEPVFEYIPGFYYSRYYNIKGYKLIGLYDEQNNFMGYANEKGKVFYKEK
jgi:hypothetical protein